MKLTLINNLWTDENNNTWSADIGEAEATRRSATLVNCTGCTNCMNCTDCRNCRNCANCANCRYCTNCTYCRYCTRCRDCTNCANCANCWNCTNCANCTDCTSCMCCRDCSYCSNCTRCADCAGFKSNPNRYAYGPIGSRKSTVTAYWTSKEDLIITTGCFAGTAEEFLEKVKATHGENEHAKAYLLFISRLRTLLTLEAPDTARPAV